MASSEPNIVSFLLCVVSVMRGTCAPALKQSGRADGKGTRDHAAWDGSCMSTPMYTVNEKLNYCSNEPLRLQAASFVFMSSTFHSPQASSGSAISSSISSSVPLQFTHSCDHTKPRRRSGGKQQVIINAISCTISHD